MLDTGAQPNTVKKSCINDKVIINGNEILQLTGITEEMVNTLSSVKIPISSIPVTFHVVTDDFPIIPQGILGSTFFIERNECINYAKKCITWHRQSLPFKDRESVKIPARTNFGSVIRIANTDIKTGYLLRLRIYDGVFAGDSIVTCINDKAYVRIINTLEFEIEVLIPTIRLIEIEKISYEPPYNHNTQKQTQQNETITSAEDKAPGSNHYKNSLENNNTDNKNPNEKTKRKNSS
ncbi:hypothetical protein ALC57_09910 [Trachymyrmex cornetzi]|uniref:Peptidase A2 domain-containing protein n=1 Tax=Trachymyrmex cornetzi TaxID=471704 RepID=A0A151J4X1_9HYME|nr:hypothetical protein ALC57_09910 [Trachymyrmex cornetzi]